MDIKELLAKTEDALEAQLFKYSCFRKVPSDTLQASLKAAKISIDKAVTKGCRETSLRRTVDMIVLGSVAKNDQGLLIETKFYTSGGKLILSHIARARGAGDIQQREERDRIRRGLVRLASSHLTHRVFLRRCMTIVVKPLR